MRSLQTKAVLELNGVKSLATFGFQACKFLSFLSAILNPA
jgi:hypothetical protein